MKKYYCIVYIYILLFISCSSNNKLPLWDYTINKSKLTIFGSLQAVPRNMENIIYPIDESIDKAYKKSNTIVFINDPTKKDEYMQLFNKHAYLKNEEISSYLDKNALNDVKNIFKYSEISKLKPWALEEKLTEMISNRLDLDYSYGTETQLKMISQQEKKRIIGLEEPIELIKLYESIPEQTWIESIILKLKIIKNEDIIKAFKNLNKNVVIAWKQGNQNYLEYMENQYIRILSKYFNENELNIFRKDNFLNKKKKKIAEKLQELSNIIDTYFVCIDINYLYGQNSIIASLKQKQSPTGTEVD